MQGIIFRESALPLHTFGHAPPPVKSGDDRGLNSFQYLLLLPILTKLQEPLIKLHLNILYRIISFAHW